MDAGLAELVRRDVLQVSADALSPQVGSYSFTHGMLAQVAYETLSRRDLKVRHLRVAATPRGLGAERGRRARRGHRAAPPGRPPRPPERPRCRTAPRVGPGVAGPGRRARGIHGRPPGGRRLFASAAELVGGPDQAADEPSALRAADLWVRVARSRLFAGAWVDSMAAAERAAALRASFGHERLVALADGLRGRAMVLVDPDQARSLLRQAVGRARAGAGNRHGRADEQLSGAYALSGLAESDEVTERALVFAQELGVDDRLVADLLIHRGVFLNSTGPSRRGDGLVPRGAAAGRESTGSIHQRVRASLNLGDAVSWESPSEALPPRSRRSGWPARAGRCATTSGSAW